MQKAKEEIKRSLAKGEIDEARAEAENKRANELVDPEAVKEKVHKEVTPKHDALMSDLNTRHNREVFLFVLFWVFQSLSVFICHRSSK